MASAAARASTAASSVRTASAPTPTAAWVAAAQVAESTEAAVLRWPQDTAALLPRRHLRAPTVLLVAPGLAPPALEPFEDWARTTADNAEIKARRLSLGLRHGAPCAPPRLDDGGVLRFRGMWAALPSIDVHIVALLLVHLGDTVPLAEIQEAGWPGDRASPNALRLRLMRLRRVLGDLDLELRSVRNVGYALVVPRNGVAPRPRYAGAARATAAPTTGSPAPTPGRPSDKALTLAKSPRRTTRTRPTIDADEATARLGDADLAHARVVTFDMEELKLFSQISYY